MLTTLRIKNLALVADLTLEFKAGFNAITGETGAGKSILIGALNLILGQRADRNLIRNGTDSCTVEAVFELSALRAPIGSFLAENGIEPCEGNSLFLKRSFTSAGLNRQFINGSSTTLSVLDRLGERLVDIHGPHEHQSLLHRGPQLAIIDSFARLQSRVTEFQDALGRLRELCAERDGLLAGGPGLAERMEHLRFQVQEITAAGFRDGEEESLASEHARASNSARLLEITRSIQSALSEEEEGLLAKTPAIGRLLVELKRIDEGTASFLEVHTEILEKISELHHQVTHYADKLEIDPERLGALEQRLDLLHSLKRKYGKTISQINAFGQEVAAELTRIEERDALGAEIDGRIETVWQVALQSGQALSAERRESLPRIAKATVKQLKTLGFMQSRFEIDMKTAIPADPKSLGVRSGFDEIEFMFSPNAGEPLRPLREIASSGELARVMLALKTVLAVEDEIPVLIFDEVDANVGGETASAVGEKMRQIGNQRQVLCITHLAPVAARATHHFFVDKKVVGDRTLTSVTELEPHERVEELARMLGGKNDAARRHAEALLKE